MNTFERGQVKILIYRDDVEGIWYGSALEFNLTIDGDDKNTVFLELDRAIKEYVRSAQEIGSAQLLNQESDPELLALWESRIENRTENIESPYTPHFAGSESLVYA
ncbi:MAG: hypothetical protein KBC35_02540 [Candidatus Pacebacteria bacterium]|jgi:hypothetical protein|nr:hypothetical protein [Candidatus Paceibacterota bacterium]